MLLYGDHPKHKIDHHGESPCRTGTFSKSGIADEEVLQARGSAKKTASGNAFLLTLLRNGFLATNTVYLLVRFWLLRSSVTKSTVFGYAVSESIAVALWFTLQSMAAQGNDLQQSGLTQYMFDIIYVTWFVQLASLLWSKFWYLYLIVSDTSSFQLVGTMY